MTTLAQTTTTTQTGFSPFALGAEDARLGNLCLPELFLPSRHWESYALGFDSVQPDNILANQILDRAQADYAELDSIGRDESLTPFLF